MAVLLADRLLPDVAQWADELTAIRHDLQVIPSTVLIPSAQLVSFVITFVNGVSRISIPILSREQLLLLLRVIARDTRSVFVPIWIVCR